MTEQRNRKPQARTPVSAHPAFPAIVALWFAALLGLGSLVLPIALFERASEASGLAAVVAQAQAPLGTTARIVIASLASGLGLLAGLAIARQAVAASEAGPAPQRAASDIKPAGDAAKRPIRAHEELGDWGLDADDLDDPRPGQAPEKAPLSGYDSPVEVAPEPLDLSAYDIEEAQDAAACAADHPPAPHAEEVPEPSDCTPADRGAALAATELAAGPALATLVDRFARALERHREQVPSSEASPAEAACDDELADESYSSLLAMRAPTGRGADQSPSPISASAAHAERALREALEKLQRISSVA